MKQTVVGPGLMLKLVVAFFAIPVIFWSGDVFAASVESVDFFVDAESIYIDKAGRPDFSVIQPMRDFKLANRDSGRRSLGLKHLKLGLEFNTADVAEFRLLLRPDANLNGRNGLEMDSRAGEVYRPASAVTFLDAYDITYNVGKSLAVQAGVFESMAIPATSYRQPLNFGLQVKFPEKYSAIVLGWIGTWQEPTVSGVETRGTGQGLEFDLIAFQGDHDRSETAGYEPRTYDRAPESNDPYWGGAFRARYRPLRNIEVGLLAASTDERLQEGVRSEIWIQGTTQVELASLATAPKVALDFRYAKEKWRTDIYDYADRIQQSISLTGSVKIFPDIWLISGFHSGRSERLFSTVETDKVRPFEGDQIDVGIMNRVGKYLELGMQYSQESRTRERDDGADEGGFLDIGSSKRSLKRMAAYMNYTIGR